MTTIDRHGAATAIRVVGNEGAGVLNVPAARLQDNPAVLRGDPRGSDDTAVVDGQGVDITARRLDFGGNGFDLTDIVYTHSRRGRPGVLRLNGQPLTTSLDENHVRTGCQ